ncbi:MAG TPA: hypothetical protein VMT02_07425 [Burkholderiales bacterium]|nr:hypothetical protein [Burkholderiales bacterium]
MADEHDPKVSAAYRALGPEEPSRAVDDAILAAARRPAQSWSGRWAVPLSLAAVVVLSVVVTLRLQHEQPELVTPQAPPAAAPAAPQEAQPETLKLKVEDQLKLAEKPARKPAARRAEPKPFAEARSDRAPAAVSGAGVAQAPAVPLPPAASGELASRRYAGRGAETPYRDSALRREEERVARDAEAAARAPQAAAALAKRAPAEPAAAARAAPAPAARATAEPAPKTAVETPEHELERIARLRAEGRHDEADKALAEFRKRYPEFRIPEEMLKRVERR